MGADAALRGALTSAAPTTSCDLSPGLLTIPGTSAAMGALAPTTSSAAVVVGSSEEEAGGWRGATEAQLREMERAWDEYKVGGVRVAAVQHRTHDDVLSSCPVALSSGPCSRRPQCSWSPLVQ
jgi:hypothetical protein